MRDDAPVTALEKRSFQLDRFAIGGAVLLAAVQIALWYPGILNNDSAGQYQQALSGHFTDWHPPIMALLWRALEPVGIGRASLFVLNTTLYWLGFALVAQALRRQGSRWGGLFLLASGASPLFLFETRFIITDVGLASALIAIAGIFFWFISQGRKVSLTGWIAIVPLTVYALLVRTNAGFAVVPLVVCAATIGADRAKKSWLLITLVGILISIPIATLVNRHLIGASDSGAFARLPIYDIAGISHLTGDHQLLRTVPDRGFEPNASCYTPLFWDTILTPRCDNFWSRLPQPGSASRQQIFRDWLVAISRHPVAYAVHRLLHFNSETLFLLPAAPQCVAAREMHACGDPNNPQSVKRVMLADYALKSALVWPITWLALGAALLASIRNKQGATAAVARTLLVSGLFYGCSYLFVGLATNVRYFLWTGIAVQTALLLLLFDQSTQLATGTWKRVFVSVALVVALGYLFRIAGLSFLLMV